MKFFSIIFISLVLLSSNYSAAYSKNSYFNNGKKLFEKKKYKDSKFYFEKVLPRAEQHYKSAISGSSNIMNFKFN